jgi:hypothetical protein
MMAALVNLVPGFWMWTVPPDDCSCHGSSCPENLFHAGNNNPRAASRFLAGNLAVHLPPQGGASVPRPFANDSLLSARSKARRKKPMSQKIMTATVASVLLGLATIALTSGQAQAEKRTFTVAAVEMKGGVTVDKEPFPTDALPAGPGYVLNKPDQTGRWEVSVYMWMPSQIIVNQDDDVTLEFVGINGANHPTTIVGYDKSFVLKRGQVTKISFKADKAGLFAIQCGTHKPSMAAEFVVLPRK